MWAIDAVWRAALGCGCRSWQAVGVLGCGAAPAVGPLSCGVRVPCWFRGGGAARDGRLLWAGCVWACFVIVCGYFVVVACCGAPIVRLSLRGVLCVCLALLLFSHGAALGVLRRSLRVAAAYSGRPLMPLLG